MSLHAGDSLPAVQRIEQAADVGKVLQQLPVRMQLLMWKACARTKEQKIDDSPTAAEFTMPGLPAAAAERTQATSSAAFMVRDRIVCS